MKNIVSEPVETYNQKGLGLNNYVDTRRLSPILKWAGGKEQELKYILPNLPQEKFADYYEPFVGWGAAAGKYANKGLKYSKRISNQNDLFHAFPNSFDNHIIKNGAYSKRLNDRTDWFEMPGSINGVDGMYQIGANLSIPKHVSATYRRINTDVFIKDWMDVNSAMH